MNNKAQLFTLDLLLALVPLTLVLGMSANAISGVAAQIQEYAYFYSMQRQASDAADVLVKTPGEPPNWNLTTAPTTVGLVDYSCNRTAPNLLDYNKITATDAAKLSKILKVANFYFEVYNLNTSSVVKSIWSNTTSLENAANIFIVQRIVNIGGTGNSTISEEYNETDVKDDKIEFSFVLPSCVEILNISIRVTTGRLDGDYVEFEMKEPSGPSKNYFLFIGTNLSNFNWDDAKPYSTQGLAENGVKNQGENATRSPDEENVSAFLKNNLVAGLNTVKIEIKVRKKSGENPDERADIALVLEIIYETQTPVEGRVTLKAWR